MRTGESLITPFAEAPVVVAATRNDIPMEVFVGGFVKLASMTKASLIHTRCFEP